MSIADNPDAAPSQKKESRKPILTNYNASGSQSYIDFPLLLLQQHRSGRISGEHQQQDPIVTKCRVPGPRPPTYAA